MKQRNNTVIFVILLCALMVVPLGITSLVSAQTGLSELSIESYSYNLTSRENKGNTIISHYIITIYLKNSGIEASEPTTVNLYDEEMKDPNTGQRFPLINYTTVGAGETKAVNYVWPTVYYKNQNITIEYFPTIEGSFAGNSSNSGSLAFLLQVVPKKNSTPGFELLLVLSAFALIAVFKRYR